MTTAARGQRAKAPGLRLEHMPVLPHSSQPMEAPPNYCWQGTAKHRHTFPLLKAKKQGCTPTWGVREIQKTAGWGKNSCHSPVPEHLRNLTSNCFLIFLRSRLWRVLYKGFNPQIGTDRSYGTWELHSLKENWDILLHCFLGIRKSYNMRK